MDNIFKYLREEETGKERMKPFSAEELSKEFEKLGFPISNQSIRRLENGVTKKPSDIQLKAYSAYFNKTTDYLLGLQNNAATDEENIVAISNYTGLSLKAISALQAFSQDSKDEKGLFQAQYATSIEAIDFILSYCYDARNHSNYVRGLDIFHFIWSYLNADNVEMQTPERYRCGFNDIKEGDKIVKEDGKEITVGKDHNGLAVIGSDGTLFDGNKITFHEKSNPKNCYNVEFADLYKKHALGEIEKSLDKMKEAFDKERTDRK